MSSYRTRFYAPNGPLHPWVTRIVDGHTEVFFWRDPCGDTETLWMETYVAGEPVAGAAFGGIATESLAKFIGRAVRP